MAFPPDRSRMMKDTLKPRRAFPPEPSEPQEPPNHAVDSPRPKSEPPERQAVLADGPPAAERSRDELLAVIAHELRTPLSAILAWTRMLIKGGLDPDTYARAADSIDRNARLMARLLDDILEWSLIIEGKIQLRKAPVELCGLIQSAIETLRPAADAKGVRFLMEGVSRPRFAYGDCDRLREVVWNLLSNAIKFSFENGEVKIRLEREGAYEKTTVIDNGPGIENSFLPHVFERFRQAEPGIARTKGGLGLGLAIVRQLVELHGGSVSVANQKSGHGAVFTVRIPTASAANDARPRPT